MAVEKSAVREGTRWDIRGRVVVVDEVTDRSVIFTDEQSCRSEVMKLEGFLSRASDPLRAEHASLMDGLRYCSHDLPVDGPTAKLLMSLRDAAFYLLERMPPTVPPYVEPAPAAPKAEPAPVIAEAPCAVAEAEPLEDYAIPMPDYEPPSAKKRRF